MKKGVQHKIMTSLLRMDEKYLIALSGGADSVFLFVMMKMMGYTIEAVHCNFHLRGKESDRDETFCKLLCERMETPLHIVHFDTTTYAELHKVSIEMAARTLRYTYFEQLRKDIGATAICVAHHKDDSVETVLMNLIRGTGLRGLTGIQPRNGYILRPLLNISRSEIEEYLHSIGQEYVTDSTNLETVAKRNKVRLELIPLLKTVNPSVCEDIAKTAWRLSEANRIVDKAMEDAQKRVTVGDGIDVASLMQEPSPEYLLFHLLTPYGFTPSQIETVFKLMPDVETGTMWSSQSHDLLYDRGRLLIEPRDDDRRKEMKIPEEGTYIICGDLRLIVKRVIVDDEFVIPKEALRVAVDCSKVVFPLTIRTAKKGDRFTPFGMRGSKLVSDYLTDKKKNIFEKRRQLVVCDANDRIVWLVGERIDNHFAITDIPSTCQKSPGAESVTCSPCRYALLLQVCQ